MTAAATIVAATIALTAWAVWSVWCAIEELDADGELDPIAQATYGTDAATWPNGGGK